MSKIRYNILANFAGRFWTALMGLVFIPLYVKFIGIEAYGLLGFSTTLQGVLSLLDLGLGTTLNRELARLSVQENKTREMRNLVRTLEVIYWSIGISIGVVISTLSSLIARYWVRADQLSLDTVHQVILIMGLLIALQWPNSLYSNGLMGLQQQVLVNGINMVIATLRSAGAVLVLWLISPSIQAFFIWQICVSILQTSLVALFLWQSLPKTDAPPSFKFELLLANWGFAAGITKISTTVVILTQLDKIILSKILTLEMFGYYTFATVVANTLYHFIGPVFVALFPRFSQLVSLDNQSELKKLYHQGCQLMSVIILPPALVATLFSPEILWLWTGNSTLVENTYRVASLLIIGTALNGLMNLPYGLQLAHGWTILAFYTNLISIVVLVPLLFYLTIHYGLVGAATGWIILNSSYVLINIQIMHRRLLKGEQWHWYLIDVGVPLLAAIIFASLWRPFIHIQMSALAILLGLVGVSTSTLMASALATPQTRFWLINQISQVRMSYGR